MVSGLWGWRRLCLFMIDRRLLTDIADLLRGHPLMLARPTIIVIDGSLCNRRVIYGSAWPINFGQVKRLNVLLAILIF